MGAPNLALDSILVSPKPGMDLKRGVPGKAGVKSESEGYKDFDSLLKPEVAAKKVDLPLVKHDMPVRKNAPAKVATPQHAIKDDQTKDDASQKPVAQDTVVSTKDDRQPQSSTKEEPSAEKSGVIDASASNKSEAPKEAEAKDGSELLLEAMLMIQGRVQQNAEQPKSLELSENENPSESVGSDAVIDQMISIQPATTAEGATKSPQLQLLALAQQVKPNDLKLSANLKSEVATKENAVGKNTAGETSELDLMSALKQSNMKAVSAVRESDQGVIENPQGDGLIDFQKELNSKSLKHVVDGLWVQQNLENQTVGPTSSTLQFVTSDVVDVHTSPELVRTSLVKDIQPTIHQMVMNDKGGEMTLSLRPAHLGMVKIHVQVNDGAVKVALQTETPQARAILHGQVKDLQQNLNQSGLKVEAVSVTMSSASSLARSADSQSPSQNESQGDSGQKGQQQPTRHEQSSPHKEHKDESFAKMMNDQEAA